eukprot:2164732-Alexandrium_andersonii.AAC.1
MCVVALRGVLAAALPGVPSGCRLSAPALLMLPAAAASLPRFAATMPGPSHSPREATGPGR